MLNGLEDMRIFISELYILDNLKIRTYIHLMTSYVCHGMSLVYSFNELSSVREKVTKCGSNIL